MAFGLGGFRVLLRVREVLSDRRLDVVDVFDLEGLWLVQPSRLGHDHLLVEHRLVFLDLAEQLFPGGQLLVLFLDLVRRLLQLACQLVLLLDLQFPDAHQRPVPHASSTPTQGLIQLASHSTKRKASERGNTCTAAFRAPKEKIEDKAPVAESETGPGPTHMREDCTVRRE